MSVRHQDSFDSLTRILINGIFYLRKHMVLDQPKHFWVVYKNLNPFVTDAAEINGS